MKSKIINFVKKNKFVYFFYKFILGAFVNIAGLFIHVNSKKIIFVANGGRKYFSNVSPIYEQMLMDKRFKEYCFVWAFINPSDYSNEIRNERTSICKIDTINYFKELIQAKFWITDISVQRGLNIQNAKHIYINAWHGAPLKYIGYDIKDTGSFHMVEKFDIVLAEGNYDADIMTHAFNLSRQQIATTGYPRNDIMFNKKEINQKVNNIRKKYNIPNNKLVILYAPTYRDYQIDKMGNDIFNINLSKEKFEEILGSQYVMLIRAHRAVTKLLNVKEPYIDVSDYPDVEHILPMVDILISDYSSIIFDFSLLGKPIFLYTYDYDEYRKKRGLYLNYDTDMPFHQCSDESTLFNTIRECDYEGECVKTIQFAKKHAMIGNNAAEKVVDEIYNRFMYT